MSEKNKRRSFLDQLLNKQQENDVTAALDALMQALDGAGVDRKEYTGKKQKAVLEELRADVLAILQKITDSPDESLADQLIAVIMGALANGEQPAEEEPMPAETMQEGEDEEEDKVPVAEQFMEANREIKALAKESIALYRDIHELFPAMVDMAKAVAALTPLIKEAGKVEALEDKIKALEDKVNLRPRQASQIAETAVENEKLRNEIKKSADGKTVLGIAVKE